MPQPPKYSEIIIIIMIIIIIINIQYMCIYNYKYIHIGETYCTPDISTSEDSSGLSVVFSDGISLL